MKPPAVIEPSPEPPGIAPTLRGGPRDAVDASRIVCFPYEIGRELEPASRPGRDRRDAPSTDPVVARASAHSESCPGVLVGPGWTDARPGSRPFTKRPDDPGRDPPDPPDPAADLATDPATDSPASTFRLGPLVSTTGADAFRRAVEHGLACIREGDLYQINLAHRLRGRFEGDPGDLARVMLALARPAFGAVLGPPRPGRQGRPDAQLGPFWPPHLAQHPVASHRVGDRWVISASPELLIRYDPRTREIITRPMKGTRPTGVDASEQDLRRIAHELADHPKDRAELTMIVDLMRNDLGRVAEPGSVVVTRPRAIERHAGVLQAIAEVRATLREGLTADDLCRAVLPAGSVTGAPKVRAMHRIEELELARVGARGAYCGSIGAIRSDGGVELNVAIRTATLTIQAVRGVSVVADFEYPVGAGVVADSDPDAEWRETLDKAAWLRRLAPIPELDALR